jgi:hypothetical protein
MSHPGAGLPPASWNSDMLPAFFEGLDCRDGIACADRTNTWTDATGVRSLWF